MSERGPSPDIKKRQDALELRLKGLSYAEIGEILGLSRQRVQQLIRPPRHIYDHVRRAASFKCESCGVELSGGHVHHRQCTEDYNDVENLQYLCVSCHRAAHVGIGESKQFMCKRCGHLWKSVLDRPLRCAKCKTPYWDRKKDGEMNAAD